MNIRRQLQYTSTFFLLLLAGCLPASRRNGTITGPDTPMAIAEGEASYYGDEFEGRQTASGEIFHQTELTAAHREYPFGTTVRVVNLRNGLDVVVRINDRGPWKKTRIIDLTRSAAEKIDLTQSGVAPVRLEVLNWGD